MNLHTIVPTGVFSWNGTSASTTNVDKVTALSIWSHLQIMMLLQIQQH